MRSLSKTYARTWTQGAIDCYKRGCMCDGCLTFQIIGYQCQMKEAVFTLVRKFGAPPPIEESLTKTQQKIVDAILFGANNRKEIAKFAEMTETQVQSFLPDLYKLAEFDGVIYSNKRHKLTQFIDWVRSEEDEF